MEEIIKRYKKLYTCCVSDILKAMGYNSQAIDSAYRPIKTGMKICGPALTISTIPVRKLPEDNINKEALESVIPGDVVIVEEGAAFGGNMGTSIKVRGAEGLICSHIRDVQEHRKNNLPVWTKTIYTGGAHPAYQKYLMDRYNIPIGLTGVRISPRDLIFADDDGIIIIPNEIAETVIGFAEAYEKMDSKVAEELLAGKSIIDSYKAKANWKKIIGIDTK